MNPWGVDKNWRIFHKLTLSDVRHDRTNTRHDILYEDMAWKFEAVVHACIYDAVPLNSTTINPAYWVKDKIHTNN